MSKLQDSPSWWRRAGGMACAGLGAVVLLQGMPRGDSLAIPRGYAILGEEPRPPAGFAPSGRFVASSATQFMVAPPTTRSDGAAAVAAGKLYVAGGVDSHGSVTAATECFDPVTNTWTTVAPFPSPRNEPCAAAANGRIYFIGGAGITPSVEVDEYDPLTDSWHTRSPMPTGRFMAAVATWHDHLFVIGGSSGGAALDVVEEYDPSADRWTSRHALPHPLYGAAAGAHEGRIWVTGGIFGATSDSETQIYDPLTDLWSAGPPLQFDRASHVLARASDRLLVLGGEQVGFTSNGDVLPVEELDPDGAWRLTQSLRCGRVSAAGAAIGATAYIVGGRTSIGAFCDSAETLEAARTWYVFKKE